MSNENPIKRNKGEKVACYDKQSTLVSIEEYRKLFGDYKSEDNLIERRLRYMEALFRNISKNELQRYTTEE